jgi:hypothetical protein
VSIIAESNLFGKHYDDKVYIMIKKYCLTQELISRICRVAIKAKNIFNRIYKLIHINQKQYNPMEKEAILGSHPDNFLNFQEMVHSQPHNLSTMD